MKFMIAPSRIGLSLLLALSLSFPALSVQAALPVSVDGQPLPSLAPMLKRVLPAVVNISTLSHLQTADQPLMIDPLLRQFFGLPQERQREQSSLGSGIIVDAGRGLILTNHHVVAKADEIRVTLQDGRSLAAQVVGSDPETDVAVLQVPAENLSAIPFADSDQVQVGDFVVAVGNPFGLNQTVTSGIVSGLGRSGLGIEGYENFIQTDASINPGNSGGPLVNLRGELVGMNTAILAPSGGNIGIGFAIPVNMAKSIMDQIVAHGAVRRGRFGVTVQDLTPDLAAALGSNSRGGVVVTSVEPDSPAAHAGVRTGDLILRLNDHPVRNAADIRNQFGLLQVGTKIRLAILRNGKEHRLTSVITDPYRDFVPGEQISAELRGALIGPAETVGGLVALPIGTVANNSPAWQNGLREGDHILEVNGVRVSSLPGISRILQRAGGLYRLRLLRGNDVMILQAR